MSAIPTTRSMISRILLPGIILQSVLIGGGFATGREIVEYGGRFGSSGWISGLAIFFGFSILASLQTSNITTLSFQLIDLIRKFNINIRQTMLKNQYSSGIIPYDSSIKPSIAFKASIHAIEKWKTIQY